MNVAERKTFLVASKISDSFDLGFRLIDLGLSSFRTTKLTDELTEIELSVRSEEEFEQIKRSLLK